MDVRVRHLHQGDRIGQQVTSGMEVPLAGFDHGYKAPARLMSRCRLTRESGSWLGVTSSVLTPSCRDDDRVRHVIVQATSFRREHQQRVGQRRPNEILLFDDRVFDVDFRRLVRVVVAQGRFP